MMASNTDLLNLIKNSTASTHQSRKSLVKAISRVIGIDYQEAEEELAAHEKKGLVKCNFDGLIYHAKIVTPKIVEYKSQEPTSCTTIVYDIYNNMKMLHVGEDNAVSMNNLSTKFDISDRKLRQIVFNINNRLYSLKNGNTFTRKIMGDNNGYYIVSNDIEKKRYLNKYKHKLIEAVKTLKIAHQDFGLDEQFKLKLSEFENEIVKSISDDL